MNTMIERLFVTPVSWLLAVPIVLLDRLLSPNLTELPDRDSHTVLQRDADR
ncbi:hypothetical protein [Rhodococcus indonesiensis]|uniref:hypothetical protein n=1 Tax=Rhodococcus indonesiensis TaxID=3055869 RepID=UPI0039F65EDD